MRPATVARLRELGYPSYQIYLKSSHWARIRSRYKSSRSWVCLCGETDRLQLHHKTYERVGAEQLDDLQALCDRCHSLVHELERQGLIGIDLEGFFAGGSRSVSANQPSFSPREKTNQRSGKRIHTIQHSKIKRDYAKKVRAPEEVAEDQARRDQERRRRKTKRKQAKKQNQNRKNTVVKSYRSQPPT